MSVWKSHLVVNRYPNITIYPDERKFNETISDMSKTFSVVEDNINCTLIKKKVECKKNYFKRRSNLYNLKNFVPKEFQSTNRSKADIIKIVDISDSFGKSANKGKSRNVRNLVNNDSSNSDSFDIKKPSPIRLIQKNKTNETFEPYYKTCIKFNNLTHSENIENLPTQTSKYNNKKNTIYNKLLNKDILKSCVEAEKGFKKIKQNYAKQFLHIKEQADLCKKIYVKEKNKPNLDMISLAHDDLNRMNKMKLSKMAEKEQKENDYNTISRLNEMSAFKTKLVINSRMGIKQQQVRNIRLQNGHMKHEMICSLNAQIDMTVNKMFDRFKLKKPGQK